MRKLGIAALVILLLLVLGHCSGSQPQRDAVAAASAELDTAFEARFVEVGDVKLHVVMAGPEDGEPVLLLHGFPEFWYAWRGPAAVLARAGFRVIMPDQRGYNLSDKPGDVSSYRVDRLVGDVVGLIDALGYDRVALAVQDWGGAVGWRAVIEHPDRISRFAVIDAFHPLAQGEADESTISWYRTFLQIPWLPGYTARLGNWRLLTNNLRATVGRRAEAHDHHIGSARHVETGDDLAQPPLFDVARGLGDRHLQDRAAREVDAQVEALDEHERDAGNHDRDRHNGQDARLSHEIDLRRR